jgi:hypothetical protein
MFQTYASRRFGHENSVKYDEHHYQFILIVKAEFIVYGL